MQSQNFLCPLCQNNFGNKPERLELHLSQVHNVSKDVVGKLLTLSSSTSAILHRRSAETHEENEPTSASRLVVDESSSFGSGKLSCPPCSSTFDVSSDLCKHQADACGVEMAADNGGRKNAPMYICYWTTCRQRFSTVEAVRRHFCDIHTDTKIPTLSPGESTVANCVTSDRHAYRFRCTQCSLAFISQDKLKAHQQYHIIRAATKCAICGRTFRSKAALKKHVESTHINLNAAELVEYKARLMSTSTTNDADDSAEQRSTVAGNYGSVANIVAAELRSEENLNTPEMALAAYRDDGRKFRCDRCKMAFTKQSFLSIHNRTMQHRKGDESAEYNVERYHDPSRPYKCEICKESFTQKSILLVHLNSVLHLHKMKKSQQGQPQSNFQKKSNNNSPVSQTVLTKLHYAGRNLTRDPGDHDNEQAFNKFQQLQTPTDHSADANFALFLQSLKFGPPTNGGSLYSAAEASNKMAFSDQVTAAFLRMASLAPYFESSLLRSTDQSCSNVGLVYGVDSNSKRNDAQQNFPSANASLSITSNEVSGQSASSVTNSRRATFRRLLEDYGFEVVMQYNEGRRKRSGSLGADANCEKCLNNESSVSKKPKKFELENLLVKVEKENISKNLSLAIAVPELTKCTCSHCRSEFSSVWVLKAHIEQVHGRVIPVDQVEKISEEFKAVFDKKILANGTTLHTTDGDSLKRSAVGSKGVVTRDTIKHHQEQPVPTRVRNEHREQAMVSGSVSSVSHQPEVNSQAAAAAMSLGLMQFPFMCMPFNPFSAQNPFLSAMLPPNFDPRNYSLPSQSSTFESAMSSTPFPDTNSLAVASSSSAGKQQQPSTAQQRYRITAQQQHLAAQQQKRARTRISDDQLKVLREYFDINNSPTEEQIERMSLKSGLPQKVIKHWFRNTLFKERQRSKDSPYNFNIPPSISIDFEEYEKTGETKVINLNPPLQPSSAGSVVINCDPEDRAKDASSNLEYSSEKHREYIKTEIDEQTVEKIDAKCSIASFQQQLEKAKFPILEDRMELISKSLITRDKRLSKDLTGSNFKLNSERFPVGDTRVYKTLKMLSDSDAIKNFTQRIPFSPSIDGASIARVALSPVDVCADGRRANRTRFAEWQVKALHDYFDKNAYPKDNDLETLSNNLNLNPRVIVVWFQNARQKARKVYENSPPCVESSSEPGDRFSRTAGLNYKCSKCKLVFQRYYELMKHQMSLCFKDDVSHCTEDATDEDIYQRDNMSYDNETEQTVETASINLCSVCPIDLATCCPTEKIRSDSINGIIFSPSHTVQPKRNFSVDVLKSSTTSSGEVSSDATSLGKRQRTQILPNQLELLYGEYRNDCRPSQTVIDDLSKETGLGKRVVQVWFQNTRMRERRGHVSATAAESSSKSHSSGTPCGYNAYFNKRCPFCGILFHSKANMESHAADKHRTQRGSFDLNVDHLPVAEQVPTIATVAVAEFFESDDDATDNRTEETILSNTTRGCLKTEASSVGYFGEKSTNSGREDRPLDLSRALPTTSSTAVGRDDTVATFQTPNTAYSNDDEISFNSMEDDDLTSNHSGRENTDNSPPPQRQLLAALTRPQKRFRTHLTLQQIKIMKRFFQDFKTPTMSECETLGNEIGLYKRVIQVWFQNARAKEKKVKVTGSGSESVSPDVRPVPAKCDLCNFPYSGRTSLQDHCFGKSHIDSVKRSVEDPLENGGRVVIDVDEDSSNGGRSSSARSQTQSVAKSSSSNGYACRRRRNAESPARECAADDDDASTVATAAVARSLSPYVYSGANPSAAYSAYSVTMPGGFASGGALPFYDPNLHGTPVSLLQIPAAVMQSILDAMRTERASKRFAQDGKTLSDLVSLLDNNDGVGVSEEYVEVGWACRRCETVFREEALFANHQRLVCRSKSAPFKLIQMHYECVPCSRLFGTQLEFMQHYDLRHSSPTNSKPM